MKMISFFVLTIVFMSSLWSAAFAADHNTRFKTYQEEIKSKSTGVYVVGDDLYVHVRLPFKKEAYLKKTQYKALFAANDLLREWAIDYASDKRKSAEWETPGVKYAASILDSANPIWFFHDWNVKFPGQEFSGADNGFVWLGRCASKSQIVKQIPDSFYRKPGQEAICKYLKLMIPMMLKKDSEKTYAACSIVDLCPSGKYSEETTTEFTSVNEQIQSFLGSSEFAKKMRVQMDEIARKKEKNSWSVVSAGNPENKTECIRTMVTNVIVDVIVKTNMRERVQTEKERAAGFSRNGRVLETSYVSDEGEIVETVVEKTTVTRRGLLRKSVVSEVGSPDFQRIFLSGWKTEAKVSPRTELGSRAIKAFFENGMSFEDKSGMLYDALSENPYDSELWNLYGRCLYLKNDLMPALICFRRALALDSSNEYVLTNLAAAYHKLGHENIGYGYATLVLGTATNEWCRKQAKMILFGSADL